MAVIALEYRGFRGGCDAKVWHPAPVTRPIRGYREKKERAAGCA